MKAVKLKVLEKLSLKEKTRQKDFTIKLPIIKDAQYPTQYKTHITRSQVTTETLYL